MNVLSERPDLAVWVSGGAVAAAAWVALIAAAGDASLNVEALRALCLAVQTDLWRAETFAAAALMWVLMSVAMMLPTALPAIGLYARLVSKERAGRALTAMILAFAGGYLAVWTAAAACLAALQGALSVGGVLGLDGALGGGAETIGPALAGATLLAAGLYQFSALKAACLTKCRNPLAFFLAHWREGASGAFRMGALHGAVCVGCCWALMLLMFVFGVMNLVWMAALGAAMLLEKSAPQGVFGGRWLGVAFAVAGVAVLARLAI